MAFKGFPTEAALEIAGWHCDKLGRHTHKEVAQDIHEAGVHIDDWKAAVEQLAPRTEQDEIDYVEWQYGEVGIYED